MSLLFLCFFASLAHISLAFPRLPYASAVCPLLTRHTHLHSENVKKRRQYELFKEHTEGGRWLGIQTGYSASDDLVEDYMYVETQYDVESGGSAIRQTNSIVAAEIRADCEVCFDSERLKSREVGLFSEGKLRSKHCGNGALVGPAPSPRGLGLELSLRHNDGRCRLLFVYTATEFRDIEGVGAVPSALELTDYLVVRERVNARPLNVYEAPDPMWASPDGCAAFLTGAKFSGETATYTDGLVAATRVNSVVLPATEGAAEDSIYRRVLPGRLSIDAWKKIEYTTEAQLCVHWAPEGTAGGPVYSAELRFTALNDVFVGSELRVAPPRITRYAVSVLRAD